MANLSPRRTNLRLARAERPGLKPERPDLRLRRPDLRPKRPDLRPKRSDLKLDLRPERYEA